MLTSILRHRSGLVPAACPLADAAWSPVQLGFPGMFFWTWEVLQIQVVLTVQLSVSVAGAIGNPKPPKLQLRGFERCKSGYSVRKVIKNVCRTLDRLPCSTLMMCRPAFQGARGTTRGSEVLAELLRGGCHLEGVMPKQ